MLSFHPPAPACPPAMPPGWLLKGRSSGPRDSALRPGGDRLRFGDHRKLRVEIGRAHV